MGCIFNSVVVPPEVQKVKDLRKFYNEYRNNLIDSYGDEFEGYSGDMAVDDGNLVVKKDLKLDFSGTLTQDALNNISNDLFDLSEGHCKKWGPSIAVRVGNQWVICGAYSD